MLFLLPDVLRHRVFLKTCLSACNIQHEVVTSQLRNVLETTLLVPSSVWVVVADFMQTNSHFSSAYKWWYGTHHFRK